MITVTSSSTQAECNRIYMQARREADDRKRRIRALRVAMYVWLGVLAAFAIGVVLAVVR